MTVPKIILIDGAELSTDAALAVTGRTLDELSKFLKNYGEPEKAQLLEAARLVIPETMDDLEEIEKSWIREIIDRS